MLIKELFTLQEVELLDFIQKPNKLGTMVGKLFTSLSKKYKSKYDEVEVRKLGNGNTLYIYNDDFAQEVMVEYRGNVALQIKLNKMKNSKQTFYIERAASSGESPMKMQDLYYYLLKQGYTLIGTSHSPGGMNVWKQLQKKGGVNIFGWDPKKKEPINVDMRGDEVETHATDTDKRSGDKEFVKTYNMQLVAQMK